MLPADMWVTGQFLVRPLKFIEVVVYLSTASSTTGGLPVVSHQNIFHIKPLVTIDIEVSARTYKRWHLAFSIYCEVLHYVKDGQNTYDVVPLGFSSEGARGHCVGNSKNREKKKKAA